MTPYQRVNKDLSVAGQLQPGQLAALRKAGFRSIICNRPDGEAPDPPSFGEIEAQARKLCMQARCLAAARPTVMVTGHGVHSTDAGKDLALTRDYLTFLRGAMRAAVEQGVDCEDVCRATDWSAFSSLPAFEAANHKNAFGAYLTAEREALAQPQK